MAFVIRNIMLSSQEAPSNQTKVSTPQDLRMLGHQSTLHSTQNRGHTIRFCVRRSTLEMAHIVSLESSRTPLQYSRITGYTPRCPRAVTFMVDAWMSSTCSLWTGEPRESWDWQPSAADTPEFRDLYPCFRCRTWWWPPGCLESCRWLTCCGCFRRLRCLGMCCLIHSS